MITENCKELAWIPLNITDFGMFSTLLLKYLELFHALLQVIWAAISGIFWNVYSQKCWDGTLYCVWNLTEGVSSLEIDVHRYVIIGNLLNLIFNRRWEPKPHAQDLVQYKGLLFRKIAEPRCDVATECFRHTVTKLL
jgi:hypothetical protein